MNTPISASALIFLPWERGRTACSVPFRKLRERSRRTACAPSENQVQSFQQQPGNNRGRSTRPPNPVVNQHRSGRRASVNSSAVVGKRKWNCQQIKIARLVDLKPRVDILGVAVDETSSDF